MGVWDQHGGQPGVLRQRALRIAEHQRGSPVGDIAHISVRGGESWEGGGRGDPRHLPMISMMHHERTPIQVGGL